MKLPDKILSWIPEDRNLEVYFNWEDKSKTAGSIKSINQDIFHFYKKRHHTNSLWLLYNKSNSILIQKPIKDIFHQFSQ